MCKYVAYHRVRRDNKYWPINGKYWIYFTPKHSKNGKLNTSFKNIHNQF